MANYNMALLQNIHMGITPQEQMNADRQQSLEDQEEMARQQQEAADADDDAYEEKMIAGDSQRLAQEITALVGQMYRAQEELKLAADQIAPLKKTLNFNKRKLIRLMKFGQKSTVSSPDLKLEMKMKRKSPPSAKTVKYDTLKQVLRQFFGQDVDAVNSIMLTIDDTKLKTHQQRLKSRKSLRVHLNCHSSRPHSQSQDSVIH